MYDLATIHRLNDAAALREQFPDHNCAEEIEYNPEYESALDSILDGYVPDNEYQDVKHDLEIVRGIVTLHLEHLLWVATDPRESEDTRLDARRKAQDIEYALRDLYT